MNESSITNRYLELLKNTLVGWGKDEYVPLKPGSSKLKNIAKTLINKAGSTSGRALMRKIPFDAESRKRGRDHPVDAFTMIGTDRLDNIQYCAQTVMREGVPGDFVETGVWRGGASIFMRAMLEAFGDTNRVVWCADSFKGLPAPNVKEFPQDKDADWHLNPTLAIPLEEVKKNFQRFDLLDDRVKFLVGWFSDTLATAPISQIAILRLDGDMYESTMDALHPLYPKVSSGGFVIVDDYGIPQDACRRAVHDYRAQHNIREPIIDIDGWAVYWRKE
jgi:O-methyltransferase